MEILGQGGRGFGASPLIPSPPASSSSPVEWMPLQKHPLFNRKGGSGAARKVEYALAEASSYGWNLAAWDSSSSRLYLWDRDGKCLHRLSVRFRSHGESASVEAACPSEIIRAGVQINLLVSQISLNRDGSAVHLSEHRGVYVIYIYDRISSSGNTSVCRTVFVGSQVLFTGNNVLRVLQASWHPCSVSHLGVLSSDSVFRIFDLSSDIERPEQEYFIQPFEAGKCKNVASIFPIAFAFGGEHLWDRFSVFILFSDGAVYILCPVAPFGGVFNLPFIKDIYEDALDCERKSSDSRGARDCRSAVTWLEATFPELLDHANQRQNSLPVLRARSYAPADASLSLQGPLRRVCDGKETEEGSETWEAAGCEGRAAALLYSWMGKDSILAIAWSGGQLQVDALADEVQPLWNAGCAPRLRADSHGRVAEMAMICEPGSDAAPGWLQGTAESAWTGRAPPLLRLAVVDLALPESALGHPVSVFPDPLVSERFYCLHGGGVDLITLHFLPFSDLTAPATGSPPDGSAASRPPSVWPILSAAAPSPGGRGDAAAPPPLCGFVVIADSLGDSLAVAVTLSRECILLEMRGWKDVVLQRDTAREGHGAEEDHGRAEDGGDIVSRDLLAGPRALVVPDSTSLRSLSPDSIQGRSALHQYGKLFHENFVEYAHKVHVELGQHGEHVGVIVREQQARLKEAGEVLSKVERKQRQLRARIDRAVEVYRAQERRLQSFRSLPAADRKPLSAAEKEFKAQLERTRDAEVGALQLAIEALEARLRRRERARAAAAVLFIKGKAAPLQRGRRERAALETQRMAELRASVKKLSLVNDANVGKVRLIEQALRSDAGAGRW
ncbi:nuclear pore complex protein-like protein [Wolffia australiana]